MAELVLPGGDAVDDATAKANVIGSVGTPEEAAQAIKVGKKLNLPGDTVVGSPKLFQQDADIKDQMEALNANPKLAGFVAASPVRAQAAKDDFANLNAVGSRAEDYSNPGIMSDLAEVMKSTFGKKPIGWSEEQRQLNPGLVQTFESSILMKAAIPLGDVAFRSLSAALAGSSVALAEAWEALGYPDIPTAFPGINIPIDPALKGPAGKRRLARDVHVLEIGALTELGMRPAVPVEMLRAAKEAVQKPIEIIPAEAGAKAKPSEFDVARQTAEEAPIITPMGKAAAERGEHLAPGLDPFHDQVHVAQQKIDILKLDAEMRDAQNSQLRTRAPDEFANYLRQYHGDEEISISAEVVRDLYAKEGKEIAETDGLFGFVSDLREQVARGLSDGTEVKIPVADFIAHGDPTVYEKIKDNVRLRDGVTKEEAKELAKKKPEDYLELYHGSAAEFEAFDTKHMGSGEGAQAYAYGHYLAQNKEVAADYQKRLAADRSKIFVDGKPLEEDNPLHLAADALRVQKTPEQAISKIEAVIDNLAEPYKTQQTETLSLLKRFQKGEIEIPRAEERAPEGTMYRVKSKRAENEFLDWDTPLDQQPAGKKVLEKIDPKFKEQLEDYLDRHDQTAEIESLTGGEFHKLLERWASEDEIPGVKGTPESETNPKIHVADYLKGLDIPGVKFLDQGSRPDSGLKAGNATVKRMRITNIESEIDSLIAEGKPRETDPKIAELEKELDAIKNEKPEKETRNFVVFNDRDLQILQRNEKIFADPVAKAVLESTLAEQKAMWLDRVFDSPETLGLTQDSFNRYSKKLEERAQAIDDKAMKAAEREVARRQKPEWKRNEAETREQVSNDISYSPTFMADRFLRTGEYPSPNKPESFKLDRADVELRYGKGYLPENMLAAEGLSLDDAAPFFGFDSGEAMARRLSLLANQRKELGENPRQYYARIIKEETQRRMEERYGTLESIVRSEAEDMVARSTQEEILHIEMEGIAAQAGGRLAISLEQVRASAEAAFRQTPTKIALRGENYVRAAGRAGELTQAALLKGKFDDALRYKQQQIMATMLLNEAKAFAKKAKRANTLYDNYVQHENLPAVDQFHTDYIHSLLNAVGEEVRRDPVNIENAMNALPTLKDFATGRNAQGGGILVMEVPRKNTLNEFTVDEYNDFFAMIKSLDHNGRKEKTLEVRGKAEDYEKGIDLIAKNLDTLKKKNFDPEALGPVAFLRRGIRELDSRLIKFEQLFEWIDKNDPFGPITQMVYRPIIEAEHGKLDMIAAIADDAGKIPVSRKWGKKLTDSIDNQILLDEEQNPVKLTNENKIVIALNWGNKSNRVKLMQGHKWTEADVNAFLDRHMTKMDHDFVQGVWRLFDRLGPLVEKVTTERSGVPVSLVEPVSVGAKGELPGGYYPLLRNSLDALYKTAKKVDLYDNPNFDPLPIAAALVKRTGDVYPLDLTLSKLHNRIAETVHAVFMQTPMRQAYKVWGDPIVRQGVGEAFGPEYVKQGDIWLEDIATNGGAATMNVTSRMLRENVVSLLMGWKLSTALIHGGAAFSTSIYEAVKPGGFGGANYAKAVHELGIAQFMPDVTRRFFSSESKMWETVKFVEDSSPEMRNRGRAMARDLGYQLNSIVNKGMKDDFTRIRAAHLTWSMAMVGWTDKLSAMQVWLAAYKKGELEGLLHDDSVFFADKAVRQAHGSASLVNRANIGRGEVNRWLTIAYNGYWNHNYNRTRSATRDVLGGPPKPLQLEGPSAEFGGFKSTEAIERDSDWTMRIVAGAAAFTAIIIVPAIVHDVVRPGGHKDESWIRWFGRSILSQFGGQIPMVNTATYSIMHGQRDPHVSPFDKIFKTSLDVWHDMALTIEGRKADKFVKHAAMMSQTLLGVGGTDASATAAQFVFDVNRGKERPRSVMEWSRGLITGSAKQQKGKGY